MSVDIRGICLACREGQSCPHHRGRIIVQCAQFQPIDIVSAGRDGLFDEVRNVHLGLCASCAEADLCASPKPEGGVWHCERYRNN